MIKQIFAVIGLFFSMLSAYAQDCEAVKAENKRLKFEIASLRYSAIGKAPDGSKVTQRVSSGSSSFAAQTQTDNDISFKVTSVIGDRKNQTVIVTVIVTNKAANKEGYSTNVSSFTSEEGEEFKLKSVLIGKDPYPKTIFTDAPLKTTYVFEGILPKVDKIKLLPFKYVWNLGGKIGQVEFRDLPITWR